MISRWENEHYDYPQLSIFEDKCSVNDHLSSMLPIKIDNDILLYIHIPFCASKCVFCNYYKQSNFNQELLNTYFSCLKKEIISYAKILPFNERTLKGIQFGGGTPSVVDIQYYIDLFACIEKHFYIDKDVNISFEGNVKSLNCKQYIENLRKLGVNRISFGVQSFDERFRKKWGLLSTRKEIYNLTELLQNADISNYNIDLMYNFPGQTIENTLEDIEIAFSKYVKTIDLYSLIVFPNTIMQRLMVRENTYEDYASGRSVMKYQELYKNLSDNPSIHFTMSNTISRDPNYQYNNLYIQLGKNVLNGGTVIGIGASARGYIGGNAYKNYVDINEYVDCVTRFDLGVCLMNHLSDSEIENKLLVMFPNFTFLNKKGLTLSSTNQRKLSGLIANNLIEEDNERYYIAPKNNFFAGRISSVFFSPEQRRKMTKSVLYNRKHHLNMYNQDNMNMERTV